MIKAKFLKIKSLILAMLILFSLSTIISASGENLEVLDVDVHDINCKFSCEHINNPLVTPSFNELILLSEDEMIELIDYLIKK